VSYAVDVNVLLYASDATSAEHAQAAAFLDRCVGSREVFCVAWSTLMAYLRMATHPALFARPLAPRDAERNVEALIGLPHVRVLAEEDGFWPIYRSVAATVATRGNLVPDVHLAALLRQHGIRTLYTHDRDFRLFDFLDVRDPVAPTAP
jgi:toxin-antitoxin system PIN domain toxin